MKNRLIILFIAALLLEPSGSICQSIRAVDSIYLEEAIHATLNMYNKSIQSSAAIYNGNEYIQYNPRIKGSPFYQNNEHVNANIFYDGTLYRNYPLQYDLVQQALILTTSPGQAPIRLIKEKISYFYLDKELFVPANFDKERFTPGNIPFYHQLYKGTVSVFCHHRKQIVETRTKTDPSIFKQYDDYYLLIANKIYPISTNRNLLNLLPAHREEIRNFLRKNHINLKRQPLILVSVAEYYDQLL